MAEFVSDAAVQRRLSELVAHLVAQTTSKPMDTATFRALCKLQHFVDEDHRERSPSPKKKRRNNKRDEREREDSPRGQCSFGGERGSVLLTLGDCVERARSIRFVERCFHSFTAGPSCEIVG